MWDPDFIQTYPVFHQMCCYCLPSTRLNASNYKQTCVKDIKDLNKSKVPSEQHCTQISRAFQPWCCCNCAGSSPANA